MQVDKVDRDCLAVFGPTVAAFSGHLWETTLRSQTKVHLDHQDMEMDKAGCDCLADVMAAFSGHLWDHGATPGKLKINSSRIFLCSLDGEIR